MTKQEQSKFKTIRKQDWLSPKVEIHKSKIVVGDRSLKKIFRREKR